jgi:hypothetical protein
LSALAADPMIEIELWASFVSLLRSYVAAANLNLGEQALVEEAGYVVAIIAGTTRLAMRFDAGKVTWEKTGTEAVSGKFEFLPEGRIAIRGNVLDLDHVAIDFVASVTHGGKGSAR